MTVQFDGTKFYRLRLIWPGNLFLITPSVGMESPASSKQIIAMEKQARAFLSQGRFRKARDEFKALCKIDRARFLPDLIQCNIGLVKEMLAKGQASEASQVIAYLKTIASREQCLSLEMELAIKSGKPEDNLAVFIDLLIKPEATLSEVDKVRIADQAILAFKDIAVFRQETAQLASEVQAIHEAMKALSAQEWEKMAEALRPLPMGSVFGHWKLYLKGLALFYQGSVEKAAAVLSKLPAGSVPAKASEPFLIFNGKPFPVKQDSKTVSPTVADAFCRVTGNPALGRLLAEADRLWIQEKPEESYKVLRNGLKDFPTNQLNALGVLSDFYFNGSKMLSDDAYYDWDDFAYEAAFEDGHKNEEERLRALRQICFDFHTEGEPEYFEDLLHDFLSVHKKLYGENLQLEYQALLWLVQHTTGDLSKVVPSRHKTNPPFLEMVLRLLKQCIKLDPNNIAAYLALSRVYEITFKKSDYNRLLDQMTRQFPDNKTVLIKAGNEAISRKAYAKGLQYFERAMELDRIDPTIKDALVEGRQDRARQLFKEKKIEKAREILASNEPLLVDTPGHFQRSRWAHRTVEGVIELGADQAKGFSILAEASKISPSPEAHLMHAHLLFRSFQKRNYIVSSGCLPATPFSIELSKHLNISCVKNIEMLIRVVDHWEALDEVRLYNEKEWVEDYISAARKRPFSREDILELIDKCGKTGFYDRSLSILVNHLLKSDSKDPALQLCNMVLYPPNHLTPEIERKFEKIIQEASKRQDHKSMQHASQLLDRLKQSHHSRMPPFNPFEDFIPLDDDFDDTQDPEDFVERHFNGDFDDDPMIEAVDALIDTMPPDKRKRLRQMLDGLSQLSEYELEGMRKDMEKEFPVPVVELLVGYALRMRSNKNTGAFMPPQPRKFPAMPKMTSKPASNPAPAVKPPPAAAPKPAPHKHRPFNDPNQMELPF